MEQFNQFVEEKAVKTKKQEDVDQAEIQKYRKS